MNSSARKTRDCLATLSVVLAGLICAAHPARAADALVSGTIKDASGAPIGGVTVSAKAMGSTIAVSVFTDQQGEYFFPPMQAGTYRVRAQALTYETATNTLAADGLTRRDFAMRPLKDFIKQLPGDILLAALPSGTPGDARMHRIVRSVCTGCHTISYVLQHRFDEAGWSKILDWMKQINVSGVRVERATHPVIDHNQKELAAYLARARGPGESSMNFENMRPRPVGEAARVVFREYDAPVNPDAGLPDKTTTNDGSDWALGTPSGIGSTVQDAWVDQGGDIWFSSNVPNHVASIARINGVTGEIKNFRLPGPGGYVAPTLGMTMDSSGAIWFSVNTGKGGLGRIDPATEKIEVYTPPGGMMPTGGATTIDFDGKGRIWSSAPQGALMFDPETQKFTEFKSQTLKTANGNGVTFGVAGDRDGKGWWAQMTLDIIGIGDPVSGKSSELKLDPIQSELALLSAGDRTFYDKAVAPDFNSPMPWQQGPRRMGADKNADILYVAASWGGHLLRINTRTNEVTTLQLPNPKANLPYHVHVDRTGAAWTNLWTSDQVARFDPSSATWTLFDLPMRGAEARYVSVTESANGPQVTLPYFRANKVAVMSLRSQAQIESLRSARGK